ncbi:MAG: glycosyltransferase family 39 protein [Candidatus Omnitrophica bacterium]|nr:glycosyltransferase family 39 protein [Candidatus Omnitrophota bacterium]
MKYLRIDESIWIKAAIAGLFALAFGIRLYHTFAIASMTHDGSIAYLAAAGKHNDFAQASTPGSQIYKQWTPAKNWRQFLFYDHPFCFAEIYSGLKRQDIHPPLYFWLLHLWMLIFGTHVWTGPLLNAFLAAAASILLFRIVKDCGCDAVTAWATSLIWFAAPAAAGLSLMARQYDLMTLLGLLLIWRTLAVSRRGKSVNIADCASLAAISALGLLTHFHFALLMAGCGTYLLFFFRSIGWKSWCAAIGSLALGLALFYLIFGNPQPVFARAKLQAQPFDWEKFPVRRQQVWTALSFFWGASFLTGIVTRLFFGAAAVIFLLHLANRLRLWQPKWIAERAREFPLYFFLIWTTSATAALYLSFLSPAHAMTSRYLCMTWPFMACAAASLLRASPRSTPLVSWALAFFLIYASATTNVDLERVTAPNANPVKTLRQAEAVLIDMPLRGFLLPTVFPMKDEQWLFAGRQNEILENRDKLESKSFRTIAYSNLNAYGNTVALGDELLEILQQKYFFLVKGTVWGNGNLLFGTRSQRWEDE